ncbi:MAG: hypothetical protein EA375_01695, partial [Acholeplasmataceae bacterium]
IIFIRQGKDNQMTRLDPDKVLPELIRNIYRPDQDHLWDRMLDILAVLIDKVPFYTLDATHSIEAALVAEACLFKGGKS